MEKLQPNIVTITHPGCLDLLKGHLQSIKSALSEGHASEAEVVIVASQIQKGSENAQKLQRIITEVGLPHFKLVCCEEALSIPEVRNLGYVNSRGTNRTCDWTVFFDGDTQIPADYFVHLQKNLADYNDRADVGALCGICGVLRTDEHSLENHYLGALEAFNELYCIVRRVKHGSLQDLLPIFSDQPSDLKTRADSIVDAINQKAQKALAPLAGQTTDVLQGYNQVIRNTLLDARGFNTQFRTAEDREMARYILQQDKKIIFAPDLQVKHDFRTTPKHLKERVLMHGIYSNLSWLLYDGYISSQASASTQTKMCPFDNLLGQAFIRIKEEGYNTGQNIVRDAIEKHEGNIEAIMDSAQTLYQDHRNQFSSVPISGTFSQRHKQSKSTVANSIVG